MNFCTLTFATFFLVLLATFLAARSKVSRQVVLLLGGMVFYGYWNWRFLGLIGFTSVFDYHLGKKLGAAQGKRRKQFLALDIVVNLGILSVFKYLNFFIDNVNAALSPWGIHLASLHILLPIGISFFVFEAMSYCIDIYRGQLQPYTNWLHFALFIFFFPRMIAGPIIRAADFLPQIAERPLIITRENANRAGCIFLLGLVKKVLIADRLALFVDPVFAHPRAFDSWTVWAAVVAYALQIFCDFSGYTDMAIALAKLFNLDLPLNFNLPYLATSVTDFWRRWHISLSSWLRDYLYISLGGNRRGRLRTYWNLMVTMLLGGLWHGASWTFVVWGGLHGVALAVHKAIGVRKAEREGIERVVAIVGTFFFTCVSWVFFRAQTFPDAWVILQKMAWRSSIGVHWIYQPFWPAAFAMLIWHLLRRDTNEHGEIQLMSFSGWLVIWSVVFLLWFAAPLKTQPFIYFQF